MDLTAQYMTAVLMSGAGAFLGAIYDIYRTSLKEWRYLRPFSPLFDLLFWIFSLVFVFTLLLGVNDGDVRFVIFVLLFLGYVVYRFTLHRIIVASTRLTVRFILQLLRFMLRVLYVIFVQPVLVLYQGIRQLLHLIDRTLYLMEPIIAKPVMTVARSLWIVIKWMYRFVRKFILPVVLWWKELMYHLSNKYQTILRKWLVPSSNDDDEDT